MAKSRRTHRRSPERASHRPYAGRTLPVRDTCETGKTAVPRLADLPKHADFLARLSNQEGTLVTDLYGYRCRLCGCWHLTHLAEWNGHVNDLVHKAASEEMQRWAMPKPVVSEDAETVD